MTVGPVRAAFLVADTGLSVFLTQLQILLHVIIIVVHIAIHHENGIAVIQIRLGLRCGATSTVPSFAEVLIVIQLSTEFRVVLVSCVFNLEVACTFDTFGHACMLPAARVLTFDVGG
jgi:hypothetical protein